MMKSNIAQNVGMNTSCPILLKTSQSIYFSKIELTSVMVHGVRNNHYNEKNHLQFKGKATIVKEKKKFCFYTVLLFYYLQFNRQVELTHLKNSLRNLR